MKKMFLSLAVAACFLVPQTVYAEWDWWGMAKPQQKKEAKKELKQDRKELKDINKQERKDLKAGNRLEAATMNPEMVKALKDKTDAFQKKQQQMSKELQESMKGMNEEQRAKALADYREKQYQSSAEFSRAMHEENVKSLKERLDKNPNMTAEKKAQIVADMEKQYQDMTALRDKQHTENAAFFAKLDQDKSMTPEQKQKAIRDHFSAQAEAYKGIRKEAKVEKKEVKEALKDAKKAGIQEMNKAVAGKGKPVPPKAPAADKAKAKKA